MAFTSDTTQTSAKDVTVDVFDPEKWFKCQMCRKWWLAGALYHSGVTSNDDGLHEYFQYCRKHTIAQDGFTRKAHWQNINYDLDFDPFTKENIEKLIYFIDNNKNTSQWIYVNTNECFSNGAFNIFIKLSYENQKMVYNKYHNILYGRNLQIGSTYMFYNKQFVNNGYFNPKFYNYVPVNNYNTCNLCQHFRQKYFEKQKVKAYNKYIQNERYLFEQKCNESNNIWFDVLHNKDEKWQKDSTRDTCSICETEFKFYRRKHHCRQCGIIICGNCSIFTPKNGNNVVKECETFEIAVIRLCKVCKDKSISYCIGANDNQKIKWEFKQK